MPTIFHGKDKATHDAFQQWRRSHPDSFHMTETSPKLFSAHWTQDKRENDAGRGCVHQGGSSNEYLDDKSSCYTTAMKVCSDSLAELHSWAEKNGGVIKHCGHCDTRKFPFPSSQGPVAATSDHSR